MRKLMLLSAACVFGFASAAAASGGFDFGKWRLAEATANTAVPEAQSFVVGTPELAMPDNMAFQPGRGNWILHEDGAGPDVGRNNDLWACLEDQGDDDSLSDGCVRVASLNDLDAEWTGGIFDATGRKFYVSVQHNVTGHGVILLITGWN